MTITAYDIPSKLAIIAWSPNVWKARLALNIKGLPYQTVWVEYPDIEPVCKEIEAKPTDTKNPECHSNIARYLDDQYPNTTPFFPQGSHALQAAFDETHECVALTHLCPLMGLAAVIPLNPPSEHYCRTNKAPKSGATLEEVALEGEARDERWKKVREGHELIASWFPKNEECSFVLGKYISFADLVLVSFLGRARLIFGEESGEWKALLLWQDGWWTRYLDKFDQYLTVI